MSKTFIDNYTNYTRPPCAQQIQQNSLINNNITHQNQIDMVYGRQSLNRNQYPCLQSNGNMLLENIDMNWYPERLNEDRMIRPTDKVDNIEITSKDLSPASFCSNLELLLPEFYKNANSKDCYYSKVQEQPVGYNGNYSQRVDYPSCAQMSVQNDNMHNLSKDNGNYDFHQQQYYKNGYNLYNQCQEYNSYYPDDCFFQNQGYGSENVQFPQISNIDQQGELSNEESDIIVEESEEETDYNDDINRCLYNSRCIICNCFYSTSGIQFYLMNKVAPLTMSTQKPICDKIADILGPLKSLGDKYLCNQCLGLINTIDHLEFKLNNCRYELINKYKSHTNTDCVGISEISKHFPRKIKFKHFCKHAFKCKLCNRKFTLKNLYNSHMHRHKKRFLCDICGKRFSKYRNFAKHQKIHSNLTVKRLANVKIDAYYCKVCKMIFRTNTKLKEHQNYCLGKLPFKCKYSSCNKSFTTSTKLKYHVKLKHDKKFTSICSICNIGFIKPSDYKSHMISHSTEKKYQCPKCEKSYKTMSNLNFHLKFHDKSLPFVCEICQRGFMRKEYLESHINGHKGVKKFNCHICNGKFVSQKYLDSHMKHHDGNVKKKSCNLCGKLTTDLEDHMRCHNNLKEFNCSECDVKFNTKSAMYKHRKRKHDVI